MADHNANTKKSKQPGPGRLKGAARIYIHTHQARRLVFGRHQSGDKPAIIGAVLFAKKAHQVYNAARQDNPYADWFLTIFESRLQDAFATIENGKADLRNRMKQFRGVELELDVDVAQSDEPDEIPLEFGTPYGFQAAYLVGAYDELVRHVLTARHIGVLGRRESEKMIQDYGSTVRGTLDQARNWKYHPVTRQDIRNGTAMAQKAAGAFAKTMGELPQIILDGTARGKFAPEISHRAEAKETGDTAPETPSSNNDVEGAGAENAPESVPQAATETS